jgi:hypothetical protein
VKTSNLTVLQTDVFEGNRTVATTKKGAPLLLRGLFTDPAGFTPENWETTTLVTIWKAA